MPEVELSAEIRARVTACCGEIAETCALSEDARRELEDHFQDRMLGYLDGTDPLTEEDSFCLTREHFGDTETVRAMFAVVNTGAGPGRLPRLFYAGPAMMALAFAIPWQLPAALADLFGEWRLYLMPFAFLAGIVLLGCALLWRGRDARQLDRLLGWYFLVFGIGQIFTLLFLGMTSPSMLVSVPLNTLFMSLPAVLALIVAGGFFTNRSWSRWLVIAALLLPILAGAAHPWLEDERQTWQQERVAQMPPPAQPEPHTEEVVVSVRTIVVPTKGFAEALYALALLHAFLPRKQRPPVAIPAPKTA